MTFFQNMQDGDRAKMGRWALHTLLLIKLFVLVLVVYFGILSWHEWNAPTNPAEVRQLNISGEGRVLAKPDTAVFTASVITSARKIGDAQKMNTERSNAIVAYLKNAGIPEKDLRSVNYSVSPQYSFSYPPFPPPSCLSVNEPCPLQKPPEIVSYQVNNALEVKVRDLAKLDDLLSGVVESGANQVGSVSFRIDDEEKVRAEAREKAIASAKVKAGELARQLGVRLEKIIAFNDSGSGPIYYDRVGFGEGGGFSAEATSAPAPQIQPGEQEVVSNVNLTYTFR
ncbi:MAG: SIMPL domain-containing protein [bacterium]|nr:SIMPL domain-containing protein [bacterium]